MAPEVRAYTPEFDQTAYNFLDRQSPTFSKERERLDLYVDKQLQTLLAERYNVLTSTFHYQVKNGQLWGQNMSDPAIDSFRRGRDFRRRNGNPIDWEREDAEIEGFEKIQQMLLEERDVLSISPRGREGSTYQHNFYDVFRWKDGKVEVKRYSSALGLGDYQQILGLDHEPTPEELLANPIDISRLFDSADQVHESLHRNHQYMDENTFNMRILLTTLPYRHGYLRALYEEDEHSQELHFNAMLNVADEEARRARNKGEENYTSVSEYSREALWDYGTREVEQVSVGCGSSGGFKTARLGANSSPFSVKEFGEEISQCKQCGESSADHHYHCPGCGRGYADERSKSQEQRTKMCGCGFKFGCKGLVKLI